MTQEPFVVVGRISKTHGLKGEVSVASAIETPLSVLDGVEVWFVPPPSGRRTATVASTRIGPKGTLVSFTGITSIDEARKIVGCEMLVRAEAVPEPSQLAADETYNGFIVLDTLHGDLGTVTDTIVTGANDVWVVEGGYGEVLIPVIDDVVILVDTESRTITVRLLPGLLPGEADLA